MISVLLKEFKGIGEIVSIRGTDYVVLNQDSFKVALFKTWRTYYETRLERISK